MESQLSNGQPSAPPPATNWRQAKGILLTKLCAQHPELAQRIGWEEEETWADLMNINPVYVNANGVMMANLQNADSIILNLRGDILANYEGWEKDSSFGKRLRTYKEELTIDHFNMHKAIQEIGFEAQKAIADKLTTDLLEELPKEIQAREKEELYETIPDVIRRFRENIFHGFLPEEECVTL
jgi:hypothetical protein